MKVYSLVIAIILFVTPTLAQFKNVRIDSAAMNSSLTNPSIAIVRKEGPVIAASAMGSLYLSNDGGKSWEKSKTSGPGKVGFLISDGKGTLYLVKVASATDGGHNRIYCLSSKDGGHTFDEGVVVADTPGKDQGMPSASMDVKGNLFITWTQFDKVHNADSTCKSLIFMASSSTGKKWSKPIEISQVPGNCTVDNRTVLGGMTAIGPDGKMFTSWYNKGKIYMDRSFGYSIWLQNDIVVGNVTPGWNFVIPGHEQPASMPDLFIDQSKGTYKGCLYMSWADQKNGAADTDVWFIRSNNHGDNWSAPLRLGEIVAAKQQYAPKMTVDPATGFVYILFYDRGPYDDNKTNVALAYSADSGANFKSVTISETPFTPADKSGMGTYLSITALNGIITPIWSRMDGDQTSLWTATIRQEDLVKPAATAKGKKKK
jgi:hypothetical protein